LGLFVLLEMLGSKKLRTNTAAWKRLATPSARPIPRIADG